MSMCILCVEDEASLLADMCEELQGAGYHVLAARDADQALAWLGEHRPALILCDVMLPGDKDGYFIHRHVRQQRPDLDDVPFLFLTALGQREAVLEAKRVGIDDYLVKPIDYALLLATLSARLEQVQRLRQQVHSQQRASAGRVQELFAQLPGAVLLCDRLGRLVYANPAAQRLAAEQAIWQAAVGEPLRWPGVAVDSVKQLRRWLESGAAQDRPCLALERAAGGAPVLASLVSLDSGDDAETWVEGAVVLAIFLTSSALRPLPSEDALQLMYALTPTEARVALLLAQGLRLEAIAKLLKVSAATVSFHLRNLFSKTECSRQADVMALVLAVGWSMPESVPDGAGA